jgi:DNA-binding SARP family transcriptional activator
VETPATVHVFGGVRVWVDGTEVAVPNPRAGQLLTALVVARGTVVGTHDLVEFLWPAAAPASASNQLHRLVGQVRRMFEPGLPARAPGAFIAGSSVGYWLDPSVVDSDLAACDAALARARGRAAGGEWALATEEYVRALQIVRLPLMGDIAMDLRTPALLADAARARVVIAEEALDCAWRCRRLDQVTGLVEQFAASMPFEENLQAHLIRALGRSGRRRDAMALYERVRHGLAEELGADPGEELRAAHQDLLAIGSESPAETQDDTDTSSAKGHHPAELPARVRGFTPRPEAQRLLDEIANRGPAGAVLITAIGGMGGIGKTALAVAWARDLADRFPDGQLYLNLRGFDAVGRVMTPDDGLNHLLGSIGAEKSPAVESLEARSARFRSMMTGRAMLVLLDNARDAEQVRPLLPGHEGCLVIVTSRNQLSGLVVHEGAVPVRLDRMDDEQARQLLTQRVGADRLGADAAATDRIIRSASGLPLALSIVAARLAVEPELTLSSVADELTSEGGGGRLVGYSAGRDDLGSVFAWSYDLLEPEEAHTFRRLAVHPGSEMSLQSIATLAGLDLRSARRVADRLVAASLLERRSRWFVVHDLLRDYALGLLTDAERTEVEQGLVAHYVQTTRNAWSVFGRPPVGDIDQLTSTAPVEPELFTDHHEAVDWYLHERDALIAVLHLAADRGWDRAAANIAIDWRPMNQAVDTDDETYPHAQTALEAAIRAGDDVLIAELHRDVGPKAVRLGFTAEGQAHLEKAQALYERLGDPVGQANVLRNLSAAVDMPTHERVRLLRTALDLVPGDVAPNVRAVLMSDLSMKLTDNSGSAVVDRSDYLEGESLTRGALDLARSHGWTDRIPEEMFYLTHILMAGSRPREALEVAADALRLEIASPAVRAAFLIEITKAAVAVGDVTVAVQSYQEARGVVERVGASRLQQLVTSKLKFDRYDVVEQLARLEGRLPRSAAVPPGSVQHDAASSGPLV